MLKNKKTNSKVKDNDIWLKAAVVGGLWASLEIIIGSFLHNSRLPMAGSTLAFFGTILLIGYYQLWPVRGLIIRAGLITAIMKSVSPSAIILGPMIGIMLEAVLIELAIIIAGRNFFGYFLAGILSVSSALFYKIFSMLVFYGYDLLQVYINIINFGLKQFRIQAAQPLDVLIVLLMFYIVMGSIAAILGYYAGRKAVKIGLEKGIVDIEEVQDQESEFFKIQGGRKTKISMLFTNIVAVPVGLLLLNLYDGIYGYIFISIYILLFGYVYRSSLRRLRKPVFWMQFLIIVALSAIFWKNENNEFALFQMEGLYSGIEMILRALFVVIAFSAISVELKNSRVRSFLMKVGMGKFYQSMELAFSVLPTMIALLPKSKEIISHPTRSLLLPLAMANSWLQHFKEMENKR